MGCEVGPLCFQPSRIACGGLERCDGLEGVSGRGGEVRVSREPRVLQPDEPFRPLRPVHGTEAGDHGFEAPTEFSVH